MSATAPLGEPYDWYRRGLELLSSGNPAASALLLERAHAAEPQARHVREALARALFDAGRYQSAALHFRHLSSIDPVDHYAHYGLGLSMWRRGELEQAREALAVAAALQPREEYRSALNQVRATLRARGGKSDSGDETVGSGS